MGRLAEIEARLSAIQTEIRAENADINALTTETNNLIAERSALIAANEQRTNTLNTIAQNMAQGTHSIAAPPADEQRTYTVEDAEYRSAWFNTLLGRPLSAVEERAFTTASGSSLAAIPTQTANEIIKKIYEIAPIVARCRIFHVPGNFKIALEGTNNDAALHTENSNISAASDSLGGVSLTGYEIVKLIKASRASQSMTIPAFEQYIVEIIADAIARKIENYIFAGNGTTQPGGVGQGGKGSDGAYTEDVDMVTVAAADTLAKEDVVSVYGMLGAGYERNAVWCMSKATFFAYIYGLMARDTDNVVEFANGKYYVMGAEVYFTGSLAKGVMYLGDFSYIVGNFSQDITVVRSEHSGLSTNSIDYLGACVFDSKAVAGMGAFVKLVKAQE